MARLVKSKAKGKAQMAKGKRPNSSITRSPDHPITRSPDHPITRSESPDHPINQSESPDHPITELPDGEPQTTRPVLRELLRKAIPVLPYQERWIMDDSQLKIAVWSRQSGKSFAAALRATLKCLGNRTQYIILSKGERQSRLFMEKVKDFCVLLKKLKVLPEFAVAAETDEKIMEVYFPHNRSRIIGLPANPDTARGYTGHIVLDEFAFHGDAHKIYAACFPIITRGYSIEVISTPNGTAGKFYEIAKQAGLVGAGEPSDRGEQSSPVAELRSAQSGGIRRSRGIRRSGGIWSGHRVDIYDAVAQGLPANIDLLKSGCDDEETWLQEYCCQFLSDAQNYIPIEMISTCVHEEATTEWPIGIAQSKALRAAAELRSAQSGGIWKEGAAELRSAQSGDRELYLGIDIGRKRDLTIAWLFEKVGPVLWSRVLLTLKGVSFDEQEKAICRLIEGGNWKSETGRGSSFQFPVSNFQGAAVRRCCIDQSGIGMMLAERLVQKYGAVVEPTTFTAQVKERLAPRVKQAFEERTVRIPDNREVRADLNSVKRFVTPAGNVRFDAEHTDRGHADRFWALAMVVNAASEPSGHFEDVAGLVGSTVMAGFMDLVI